MLIIRSLRVGPELARVLGPADAIQRDGRLYIHPVAITKSSLTRLIPRVGLPRNRFLMGSLTAALRLSKGWVRKDLNLVMGIGFTYYVSRVYTHIRYPRTSGRRRQCHIINICTYIIYIYIPICIYIYIYIYIHTHVLSLYLRLSISISLPLSIYLSSYLDRRSRGAGR